MMTLASPVSAFSAMMTTDDLQLRQPQNAANVLEVPKQRSIRKAPNNRMDERTQSSAPDETTWQGGMSREEKKLIKTQ
jgi:hypothetical protein